ncbi:MAG: zinc carboxypeptidase, partial [Flavobacteriaceae bacterium]|nr:zinc carboxypeptidase [Flavobacteriaceae bacterium]
EVGEWHVTHDKLVQYMYAIANSSDRIIIEETGKTYENRPLLILKVSSPDNLKNLEKIKENHVKITNGIKINEFKNMPAVVYQGFSVHGNEASASNAALLGIYYLAASNESETLEILNNTVILYDPCLNPDGLQRFANWVNSNKNLIPNPDNNDREFSEVWPGGRTNHYWFDLNRDWLPVQLPESKARIKTFTDWLPNIVTDHHEMGTNSTFFFQPGVPSRVNPLIPNFNQELTEKIAKYHSEYLDKIGSLYYSKENYDDFYFGKGSTYPDINGSIGILFEQASSRGHLQQSQNGILTFPFTIKNQLTTIISTLNAASSLRTQLLSYMNEFYIEALDEVNNSKTSGIAFGNNYDKTSSYQLAKILKSHKIDVFETNSKNYKYYVPLKQKKSRLIRAMFETSTNFQDSLFYDVSAWTFPLAFNVNHEFLKKELEVVKSFDKPQGKVSNFSDYGYLIKPHDYNIPKLINSLQEKGIRIKSSSKSFKINSDYFDYGSLLIPVVGQSISSKNIYDLLNKVSNKTGIDIYALKNGYEDNIGFGSGSFTTIKKPKIGLIVGSGVRAYDAGEIWHLFDTRYEIPITKIDIKNLNRVNLSQYTHVILPSYSGTDLSTTKIQDFLKSGGNLIAYRSSINWLERNKFINVDFIKNDISAKDVSFEDRSKFSGAQVVGGAIFETKIDKSHPITFGFQNDVLPTFRNNTIFMKPEKNSYNNPIKYTKNPLLSGYISNDNLEILKQSVPFKIKRFSSGKIFLFTDNTNFRAFWYGTNRLLMNAIFMSDKM